MVFFFKTNKPNPTTTKRIPTSLTRFKTKVNQKAMQSLEMLTQEV